MKAPLSSYQEEVKRWNVSTLWLDSVQQLSQSFHHSFEFHVKICISIYNITVVIYSIFIPTNGRHRFYIDINILHVTILLLGFKQNTILKLKFKQKIKNNVISKTLQLIKIFFPFLWIQWQLLYSYNFANKNTKKRYRFKSKYFIYLFFVWNTMH